MNNQHVYCKNKHKSGHPTTYQGVTMRSRLEASWAAYHDEISLGWDFEPEITLNGVKYWPDFYILGLDVYSEVKPGTPTPEELHKAKVCSDETKKPVLILMGQPRDNCLGQIYLVEDGRLKCEHQAFVVCGYCHTAYVSLYGSLSESIDPCGDKGYEDPLAIKRAETAAKRIQADWKRP